MTIKRRLIDMIDEAIKLSVSDIHFVQQDETKVLIQLRSGRMMVPYGHLTMPTYEKLLAYVKFHASLDLSHPMQPQSGSLVLEQAGQVKSCRVSILPTANFQSLVLRVINVNLNRTLEEIPFFAHHVNELAHLTEVEAGLILIGGPTGSGKTTTAYSLIDYLKDIRQKTVITIEDPIEYQQPDIVQMQVNESAGMSYDVGIKEILRHDPDVIVIGEIRDAAAARQAIRASLTGHLVISTIHAKNNIGMIHRLLDLGISLHDVQASMSSLVNQRLVDVGGDKKALFEIAEGKNLDLIFGQIAEGKISVIPYQTLDEAFSAWKEATQ